MQTTCILQIFSRKFIYSKFKGLQKPQGWIKNFGCWVAAHFHSNPGKTPNQVQKFFGIFVFNGSVASTPKKIIPL